MSDAASPASRTFVIRDGACADLSADELARAQGQLSPEDRRRCQQDVQLVGSAFIEVMAEGPRRVDPLAVRVRAVL